MYSFTVCPVFSQTSTSVWWEPATVGEESVASTQRARSVAREKSAVEQDMSSLTATTAKVSAVCRETLSCCIFFGCYSQRVDRQFFCDVFIQILMSVRPVSITVDRSFNAKTPRGRSVVCPKFSVDLALSRMLLETVLVSISTKRFIVAKHPIQSSAAIYDLYLSTCKDIEILKLLPSKCPHINVNFKIFNNMMTGICSLIN